MTLSELNELKNRMELNRMRWERFLTAKRNSVGIASKLKEGGFIVYISNLVPNKFK